MTKNKLTLLIDGNWLLMSRLSAIINKYPEDQLATELQLLITRSIKLMLKQFPEIDNIMLCLDGGSWRNKLDNSQILDTDGNVIEYKGTRERSEDVPWDLVFNAFDELCEMYKRSGINVYKEHEIEGDDWIWYWSNKLNDEGINCIIWSMDNDLKQLVKMDNNKCFTVLWNSTNGIFCSDYSDDIMNFLFNLEYDNNSQLFNQLITNQHVNTVNIKELIINKIIRGDQSDNIHPIIVLKPKSPTSTRKYKISQKDIDYDLNFKNDASVSQFLTSVFNSPKYHNKIYESSVNDIFRHFQYNRQLVYLDKSSYPEYILEKFDNYNDFTISTNISACESELLSRKNKLNGILNII